MGERRRETEKEREIKIEGEGGVKQMCQNCIPAMNMNSLSGADKRKKNM